VRIRGLSGVESPGQRSSTVYHTAFPGSAFCADREKSAAKNSNEIIYPFLNSRGVVPHSLESELHLTAIRRALEEGNAAVMIGAGFSRNAEGGDQLKTWDGLAAELWKELNPGKAMESFSAALVTQLAEQYARVFSPPALESLLKRLIPDNKITPGVLHEQILDLPWSEIFTTNYDTLIERAAESIVGRAHYTVISREDIPQSKVLGRRRIVKLHGSFPSQRPFIFTEEEYRQYPEKFAPFVNLVRQSLLENVFCLIGFSGEDPNFLHWIGWVRDMLDRHSLPIYLFVGNDLSLGQRKLLEARRVTPVVLPQPKGCEPTDYARRYAALFTILGTPLAPSDLAWGDSIKVSEASRMYTADPNEQRERLVMAFPALKDLRSTYPGWLVAPISVRRQFARAIAMIPGSLTQLSWYARLESEAPLVAIVLLAQYAWQQDVLLQGIDDRLAEIAIRLVQTCGSLPNPVIYDHDRPTLERLGIKSVQEFQHCWRDLTLASLRWARQELRDTAFLTVKVMLESAFPNDRNLKSEINYESSLLALYQGERDAARRLLSTWTSRSSDAYMDVRRGALLAELGDTDAGMNACVLGLQRIRRSQRESPESTRYLSEEAWACMVIRNIQRSKTAFVSQDDDSDDERFSAKIDRRLDGLAAKGFDVRRERDRITGELNAEAQPPSSPRHMAARFEIGRYTPSTRIGAPSELQSKVEAAFSWLTLVDRVALVPRMSNASFDLGSYTQAAWWVQFDDSMQRVLGVLIRTLDRDVLKPKDPSEPPHKTGWLSRYQVARIDAVLAKQVCSRSLATVESALAMSAARSEIQTLVAFHLEIISRLVIRIDDTAIVLAFATKILDLHRSTAVRCFPQLWEYAGKAMAGCFDALPFNQQEQLATQLATVLDVPSGLNVDDHYRHSWLTMTSVWPSRSHPRRDQYISADLGREVERLIQKIHLLSANAAKAAEIGRAWVSLLWLDHFGLIPEATRVVIGRLLWRAGGDVWPLIPTLFPQIPNRWPAPSGTDGNAVFRRWILSQSLTGFEAPSSVELKDAGSKRTWQLPVSNDFLEAWLHSLSTQQWTLDEMFAGMQIAKKWWDSEWPDLVKDTRWDELRDAVIYRLNTLDAILSKGLPLEWKQEPGLGQPLVTWLDEVVVAGRTYGAPFWRVRLREALRTGEQHGLVEIQKEISEHLLSSTPFELSDVASEVAVDWLKQGQPDDSPPPELLREVLCAIVSARKIPNLGWVLHVLAKAVRHQSQWVTDNLFAMIEMGLAALHSELRYKDPPKGTGIPDDEVPVLRLNCARLALAFLHCEPPRTSSVLSDWLSSAANDPLPEMRYLNERYGCEE